MDISDINAGDLPFAEYRRTGRILLSLLRATEYLAALILAIDVGVVFLSVVCRYFLHHPLDWAEEIASALMVGLVLLGAAAVLARRGAHCFQSNGVMCWTRSVAGSFSASRPASSSRRLVCCRIRKDRRRPWACPWGSSPILWWLVVR